MKRNLTKFSVFTFLCFLFINTASAQNITVSGVITDGKDNSPLPGVGILVKGTTTGTTTNAAGKYTISAPANATLVFTYIGYTAKEVAVNNQTTLDITLSESAELLEQVVVVGYGTQKRKDLTGSVAQVKGEDIARQPVLSATQAIQGKVAGVQIVSSGAPNSLPTVRIRGTGTMLAGANPLYVVDGIINEDIRNINSNDILTMDILKDASATAIYGMRAANGVILITTKKGKSGAMQIEYNATAGFKEAANLVNMAGANQYAGYLNEANQYYGSGDILITPSMLQNGANTDWYDAILKRGFQQNHNLSISGGNEKTTYLFSAGYLTDAGIIKTNDFNRLTLRANNEYNVTDWLKFSAMTSYSRSDVRNVNLDVFNIAYRAAPYVASKVDGKYGNTSLSNNISNPLLNLEKENNGDIANRLQSNFAVDLKPLSWLSFRSAFGIDAEFGKNTTYNYRYLNTGIDNVFITEGGNQVRELSGLALEDKTTSRWVWDNTITATKTFGDHNFNLLVGTTAEGFKSTSFKGSRTSVPEDQDQWYLGAGSPTNQTNDNTGDKASRNSYIGRLNYSYANRYLLTATLRADGTSRFPSQNRWGYFPSVGLGWNLVNESFMKEQKLFSALKIRASYGKVGNDLIPTSTYISLATINKPYFYDGKEYLGISFDNLADKNIRWETTTEYDLGLDFGFLDNRLTGEFNYYNKKTEDALVDINIPAILGDTDGKYTTNAATFTNKGLELGLNWASKAGNDWSYSIGGNISYNKNRIEGLNGGQALSDANVGGTFVTKSDSGQPIGSFFLLQADGVFQNEAEIAASAQKDAKPGDLRYRDISGPNGTPDGVVNDLDRAFSGSYQPKLTFGLNGNVTYKAFDLNIGTYGTSGGKVYNAKKAERENSRDNIETEIAKNRWTPNNPGSKIPRANLDKLPASTYFLEKGDFFRINNLTLGYTLPKEILSKYKFQKLRVFVTAQNLATITGYSGFTPEIVSDKTLNAGVESKIYPTTRTFAFGVNVGF